MKQINKENEQNQHKVIITIIAFRFSDEATLMLVGEAELTLELYADASPSPISMLDLLSVRIDILSLYDADENDVYHQAMENPALRQKLEAAALEHYLHPPKVPIGLPKRLSEW